MQRRLATVRGNGGRAVRASAQQHVEKWLRVWQRAQRHDEGMRAFAAVGIQQALERGNTRV
jgi:hypothetical protein